MQLHANAALSLIKRRQNGSSRRRGWMERSTMPPRLRTPRSRQVGSGWLATGRTERRGCWTAVRRRPKSPTARAESAQAGQGQRPGPSKRLVFLDAAIISRYSGKHGIVSWPPQDPSTHQCCHDVVTD